MKKRILAHPRVASLHQWRRDDGRPDGWVAYLQAGYNHDGFSFVHADTLKALAAELTRIKEGSPL